MAERPPLVVGFVVLLAAALAGVFSARVTGYEPDEVGYTHLAQGIANSLSPITLQYGGGQRLNQLYPLLMSPFWGTFGTITAFRLVHIWNALLMASAAIPVYLLTYGLVRVRWAAYLACALVAFAPWLTISLAELTEVAAFPACAWALYGMERAMAEPSPRRDLLALALIGLAAYGRLQLVLLGPVLVIAMLIHEFGFECASRRRGKVEFARIRRRLLHDHVVLSSVAIVGMLVGLPLLLTGRLTSVFGFYGNTLSGVSLDLGTLDLARSYLSFQVIGLSVIPAALTLGFFGESLIAPVSRRAHAFACLGIVTILALTLQVAEITVRFDESVLQERYLFYLSPLFACGMCAAIMLSRHRAKVALGGSIALAVLIGTTHYQSGRDAFWYQVSPAMTGFYDWIRPIFGAAAGPTADPGAASMALVGAVVLALGVGLALFASRARATRVLAVVAVMALTFCCAETVNALWRVVHGNASGVGYGNGTLKDVDWVDKSVSAGARVGQVVEDVGGFSGSRGLWEDSEFWNRKIVNAYSFGGISDAYLPTWRLTLDRRDGSIDAAVASAPIPTYMVTVSRGFPLAIAGAVVSHSPGGALQLIRLSRPLRATWSIAGLSEDGWLPVDRPATISIYHAATHCSNVSVTVSLSSLTLTPRTLEIAASGRSRRFTVAPGHTRTLVTRACGSSAAALRRLRVADSQGAAATNPQLTLQLDRVAVKPA